MARFNPAALKRLLTSLFNAVPSRSTDEELVIVCEQPGCHDASGNRSVNLKSGLTSCWRCGVGGDVARWASRLGYEIDLDDEELAIQDVSLDGPIEKSPVKTLVPYVNPDLELPRGFVPLADEPDSGYARLIGRMAARKHLDLETFIAAGAGFTRDDPRWEPYCVFPVYEWGRPVYYQGRLYSDEPGEVTKRFPSRRQVPLGSKYWLYNIDKLRKRTARRAVVVEAIFNVLSLEKVFDDQTVPVAVFKHKLSPVQVHKLSQCRHLEEIVLCFDSDATSAAWDSCSALVNQFKVTVVEMPPGVDPNDDAAEAVRRYDRRRTFSTLNRLDCLTRGL